MAVYGVFTSRKSVEMNAPFIRGKNPIIFAIPEVNRRLESLAVARLLSLKIWRHKRDFRTNYIGLKQLDKAPQYLYLAEISSRCVNAKGVQYFAVRAPYETVAELVLPDIAQIENDWS